VQIWNNGKGVPVEVHAKEKVYVPELIFGHLLTSSNYDELGAEDYGRAQRLWCDSWRHHSTEFTIETADGERGKKYKQVRTSFAACGSAMGALAGLWGQMRCSPLCHPQASSSLLLLCHVQVFNNNMSKKSEPRITTCKKSENYTCITFKLDLARFNMEVMDQDIVALMSKRVVDIAGCLGKSVKVELNGTILPVKSFVDYVGLYLDSAQHPDREGPRPK